MPPEQFDTQAPSAPRRSVIIRRFMRRNRGLVSLIILVVLVVGAFELGRYSVYQAHPDLSGQDQASAVLSKVGKLIQLPQNENPSMARVTNADQVHQAQPFLAQAQNGDVLIIYQNAGTAILYRPSTNKLIAVGPVTPETAAKSSAEVPVVEAASSSASASHATSTSSNK